MLNAAPLLEELSIKGIALGKGKGMVKQFTLKGGKNLKLIDLKTLYSAD